MNSDFSLFESNQIQIQQIYRKIRRYKEHTINQADLYKLCESVGILPELIGHSALRGIVISGKSSVSKGQITYSDFLEILKQIAGLSFTNAGTIKEKNRKFFTHIAKKCSQVFSVNFNLSENNSASKKAPKKTKNENFDEIFKRVASERPASNEKAPPKKLLTVTVNLSEEVKGNTQPERKGNHTYVERVSTQKVLQKSSSTHFGIKRNHSERSCKMKYNNKSKQEPLPKIDLKKMKELVKGFKVDRENFNRKKYVQEYVRKHKDFILRKVDSMFNSHFVLKLIFTSWKNTFARATHNNK